MKGKTLKNVITIGICFLAVYFFFNSSGSNDSPDVTPAQSASVANYVITPTLTYTPSPTTVSTYTPTPTTTPSTLYLITPTPSIVQESKTQMITSNDTLLNKNYAWSYGLSDWTWELDINQSAYDYYKNLPRAPTTNYSIYVTHPSDDKYIDNLAQKIRKSAQEEGYSEFETVSLAAAFVQSLEYTSDIETEGYDEYPRYPLETLVDNGGDCEDTAILAASIIDAMGYGVVLLRFSDTSDNPGHMAVGVKGGDNIAGSYWLYQGGKYYYLETTGEGWNIGDIPDEYKGRSAQIFSMTPVAVLTHSWEYKGKGSYIELKVEVENLGSADAENVYIYAGFDAGNNQCWNAKTSQPFTVGINGSVEATLYLTPPVNKYTRLLIHIVYKGYTVDESFSKWFDT